MLSLNVIPLDLVVLVACRGRGGRIKDQVKRSSLWSLVLLAYSKLWSFIERWDLGGDRVDRTKAWLGLPGEASASFRPTRKINRRENPIVFSIAFSLPTNKYLPLAFKKPCTFYKLIFLSARDSSPFAFDKIPPYREKSFAHLLRILQLFSRDRTWFSYRVFCIHAEHLPP